MLRIAYIPLDERPVNTQIPRDVAALAGCELLLPPEHMLPRFREAGHSAQLLDWLQALVDDGVTTLVISLDTFVYGGLIPARTSDQSAAAALARLEGLQHLISAHPGLRVYAVSLVMRATDSYSAEEEPEYWAQYGRDIHAYGAQQHTAWLARLDPAQPAAASVKSEVPTEILHDFEQRRLRNHLVNLSAISMAARGAFDILAVTSDDTALHSAGSHEQIWLDNWTRLLPGTDAVSFYPGADEVGAVLLARAIAATDNAPIWFAPVCAEPGGWDRVAEFENLPLFDATVRQIRAAGAHTENHRADVDPTSADVVLVLHAPAPQGQGRDQANFGAEGTAPAQRTSDLVAEQLAAGRRVALADVRYTNGSDPRLIAELNERGLLMRLFAYGGWNTAGNTTGAVVATSVAAVVADRAGRLNPAELERLRLTRILEDYEYQARIRTDLRAQLQHGFGSFRDTAEREAAEELIRTELQTTADRLTTPGRWRVQGVHMPWNRLFEVGFHLHEPEG